MDLASITCMNISVRGRRHASQLMYVVQSMSYVLLGVCVCSLGLVSPSWLVFAMSASIARGDQHILRLEDEQLQSSNDKHRIYCLWRPMRQHRAVWAHHKPSEQLGLVFSLYTTCVDDIAQHVEDD
jgi:hypothetical protein